MTYLIVRIWGEELGRLVWNSGNRQTYFLFNPEIANRPDVAPLLNPLETWEITLPVYGDSRRIYQSLPPFLADSLPDTWGNRLFDKWVKKNKIPRSKITPLYKLMFIGKRGMGALEFEPAAKELEYSHEVDLKSLYELSLAILSDREAITLDSSGELTLDTLLAVGTSAGGRQMKAIIAIHPDTGEIRSGQVDSLQGFDYFIIKFEDSIVPTSEIEIAIHKMAVQSGIDMTECDLINIDGINHFITKRFDRKNGKKIHIQTLAAINPEVSSYEELFDTCRTLNLSENEIAELFRRLVFNVMSNNTDDHNKNFSFMLEKEGHWKLAPFYDATFIFNKYATGPEEQRCLSLYGKVEDISKEDLISIAKENNIRNAKGIISKVAESLMQFPELAEKYQIPDKFRAIIQKTINSNLISMGFKEEQGNMVFTDSVNMIDNIEFKLNSKGYYQVSATINGILRKRFIKPGTADHTTLQNYELGLLNKQELYQAITHIFNL
ncbi:MAG: type II toxin-antitoxin system HipA family toxin [Muribaculaceae bacterium]|nr:type II toxin-antitoxin system HipA family toxin [Muribaculaceae bacterium]